MSALHPSARFYDRLKIPSAFVTLQLSCCNAEKALSSLAPDKCLKTQTVCCGSCVDSGAMGRVEERLTYIFVFHLTCGLELCLDK